MTNTGKSIGVNYKTVMPDMTDVADIEQALIMYHIGYPNWNSIDAPAADSIEGHFKDLDDRVVVLEALPISRGVISNTAPTVVPGTSTAIPSGYIWVDSTGSANKGYIYNGSTWVEIKSTPSLSASYAWTGTHSFSNVVTMTASLTAAYKFNSFLNPAARTAAITSPQVGLISFIQQDAIGNTVNKFQFYNGSAWTDLNIASYQSTAPSGASAGNIWIDSDDNSMYVYTGSAWVLVSGGGAASGGDMFFLMGA